MANYTILLIDYEPRSIERFRQPLSDAGYAVEIATDGLTGIEAFHRLSPDMVLVEAMIPKKHGFEVCQELKRTPHGRRTPVLITTGVYKGRKYRTQALHIYGCDEYIEKPIAPEQLLAVVGKFFNSKATAPSAPAESASRPAPDPGPVAPSAKEVPSSRAPQGKAPVPRAVVNDLTEDEIMARLDAILPNAEALSGPPETIPLAVTSAAPAPSTSALLAALEAEIDAPPLPALDETSRAEDPFLQMQAELNAELGSLATALALEPAPVLDSVPDPIPSDQVLSPSVLEALPAPEPVAPRVVESRSSPAPAPVEEAPGQVVSFDAKRSRKGKKHGKKTPERALTAAPAAPETVVPRVQERARPAKSIKLPSGTLVESELNAEEPASKGGMAAWIWAVLGLIIVGALYFVFFRGESAAPATSSAPPPVATPAPPPAPVEIAEQASTEPPQAPTAAAPKSDDSANLVLNAVQSPAPPRRPPSELPSAAAPSVKPAPTSKISAWKPDSGSVSTRTTHEVAPVETAPAGPEEGIAGVESIAESPVQAEAAPTIAPGTLVDDPDTPPVNLSRKLPVYSLQARELKLSGTVVMNVLVNEQGTVDQVVLVSGITGADLNESTLKAARSWTYRPATKGGVPVKSWKREQVVFKR